MNQPHPLPACPVTATRLGDGPIISPDTPGWCPDRVGTNINGPSLIRRPDWLSGFDQNYVLYFAHHQGRSIRVATADDPLGPWTIDARGVLPLEQTPFSHHVASPDVHVDHQRQRLIMYFHGNGGFETPPGVDQATLVATSHDGRAWDIQPHPLGESYFRVFDTPDGYWYALSKAGFQYRADEPLGPFELRGCLERSARHWAVTRRGSTLHCVYSRWGDQPEHLLYATVQLTPDPRHWRMGQRWPLLSPEREWEGADQPVRVSRPGSVHEPVHELRDPDLFHDAESGRDLMVYSVAGESGLAIAELHGLPPIDATACV